MNEIFGMILTFLIGLFVLYLIIYTAVKDGINKSVIGKYLEQKHGLKEERKSFLDHDLDHD